MMQLDPLTLLRRTDKWFLGGGSRLLWAPPFPRWLDAPGFWDKASYFNFDIEPVFTWTLLDEEGNEIPLKAADRRWRPSEITTIFEPERPAGGYAGRRSRTRGGISIVEKKCCLPQDVLISVVRIVNRSAKPRSLHLVAWSTQRGLSSGDTVLLSEVEYQHQELRFTKHVSVGHSPPLQLSCAMALSQAVRSYCVSLSEGSAIQPRWELTPFPEKFVGGILPGEIHLGGVQRSGLVHLALHAGVDIGAKSNAEVTACFAAAASRAEASSAINSVRKESSPADLSASSWREHFSGVPFFASSDDHLTRYYWYRWYGLKLNTIDAKEGNYQHPFVAEGIGDFRAPISYSSPCHILENRWRHSSDLARGSLLTFLENQRGDGGLRGYIDPFCYREEMFYHANWGRALVELYALHPRREFLLVAYDGLRKYAEFLDRERDADGSGLYDIRNHYETGQEYMPRYIAVDPSADRENWGDVFRLKGVDVTVYMYELKKALSLAAGWLGKGEAVGWQAGAARIRQAMLEKMWDPREEMFFDLNPSTGERTMVKAVTCFYPYMTDIVDRRHVEGLHRHLFNPQEFWTDVPVPASSRDDADFSSVAEWKGERMNCPWNGRVWPMTNSHLVEAVATTALRFNDAGLKMRAAELISKFIRMMFAGNDPLKPNCFEHYNPLTGQPSLYRGIDDYMHSWIVDLILKYVAGIRTTDHHLVIDPFPLPLRRMELKDLFVRGLRIGVRRKEKGFTVSVNGKTIGESVLGVPILLKLP